MSCADRVLHIPRPSAWHVSLALTEEHSPGRVYRHLLEHVNVLQSLDAVVCRLLDDADKPPSLTPVLARFLRAVT